MKISSIWSGRAVGSEQEYLHCLGKNLLFYFPVNQVLDILKDYQEYFSSEERNSMEEKIKKWGTPKQALKTLLEENPQADRYFYKWSALWGLILLLAVSCLFYARDGLFLAMFFIPAAVFGCLHGWGQMAVEEYLSIQKACYWQPFCIHGIKKDGRKSLPVHALPPVLVLLCEAQMQYFLKNMENIPPYIGKFPIGPVIDKEFALFQFILFLLTVWMLKEVLTSSIRYMPEAIHAFGAILFFMGMRNCLHRMDITAAGEPGAMFLFPVIYYGMGIGMALLFGIFQKPVRRYGVWMHN